VSISVVSQWIANCVVAYGVPLQVRLFQASGTFIFYTICLFLCVIFVYICIPETKGIGLEDMGKLFGEEAATARGECLPQGSAVLQAHGGLGGLSVCSSSEARAASKAMECSAACSLHLRRDAASMPNPEQHWSSTAGGLLSGPRLSSPAVLEGVAGTRRMSRAAAPAHRVLLMSRSGAVALH